MAQYDSDRDELVDIVRYHPISISDATKITTTVTCNAHQVHLWIRALESRNQFDAFRLIVSLDLKLGSPEPPFTPRRTATAATPAARRPVALLLLCVSPKCLIFEIPFATQIPPSLPQFLSNKDNIFVGVRIRAKLHQLQLEYGFGDGAECVDLAMLTAAEFKAPEMRDAGVDAVRSFVFGSDDVERPEVEDVWDEGELSNEHVRAACLDVHTCYELGDALVYPGRKDVPANVVYPSLEEIADRFVFPDEEKLPDVV